MKSIQTKGHTASDGWLRLDIATNIPESDVEAVVVIQPLECSSVNQTEPPGWPQGFFERTEGCLANDPIVRAPQGNYEIREPLL